MSDDRKHPIIDDLPEEERDPFSEWLAGQTRPQNMDGTSGYWPHDYDRWKAVLRGEPDWMD